MYHNPPYSEQHDKKDENFCVDEHLMDITTSTVTQSKIKKLNVHIIEKKNNKNLL